MRKQWMILAVTAAVSLAAAGCQKYEKIELAGEGWESALDGQSSDRQDKEAQREEDQMIMPASQVSANQTDRTKETAPAMEERSEIVYVNASSLNIRTEPGSDSQIIGRAGRGSELKRTGYSQSWSRVEYQGQVCYAASQYLTTSQPSVQTVGGGSSEGTAAGIARQCGCWRSEWISRRDSFESRVEICRIFQNQFRSRKTLCF